jgi:hypothetical protein
MKAAIQQPTTLVTRIEAGQSSPDVMHASRRAPGNLIAAALMSGTVRAQGLASVAFSAAS